ncbi:NAD(P)/FAD-dependent oxidoreductase [Chitinophaga arvensicola]|uniref:Thioredoxin reductase n=1 Tax=Chitinophaga arvensicola TaxID=29529 RepID=A0A1I0S8S2_9BACT|nr:NAD(P)/FAD-dependent oxidoreductase [Chitinophaga arvensicola]SEW52553.1 Thioredoxin reductase [Chitinophaga arvensicola]
MQTYDVIITGGSYAGLAAAMALGRSLRSVLVLDSGKPCNRQTPHSHNFLTQDGETPANIAAIGKAQVQRYPGVQFKDATVISAAQNSFGYTLTTAAGEQFQAKKLLFATGVKDEMPAIKGFAESWGISVLHCPYCHGYEVKNTPTGILGGGDITFEFAKMILNWTKDLTIFTNGGTGFTEEQLEGLTRNRIAVNDKEIVEIIQEQGQIRQLLFKDGSTHALQALYARPVFSQHCAVPEALGCALTPAGHLVVNEFQATTVPGIFAAGDATTPMRSVAAAVAAGTLAGAMINRELAVSEF